MALPTMTLVDDKEAGARRRAVFRLAKLTSAGGDEAWLKVRGAGEM
jgi:hypothetical protein